MRAPGSARGHACKHHRVLDGCPRLARLRLGVDSRRSVHDCSHGGVVLVVSYLCYRRVRVRQEVEQVERLRAMQQRDGLSDEELLRYVALHHPNLDQFGKKLAASIDRSKREMPRRGRDTV